MSTPATAEGHTGLTLTDRRRLETRDLIIESATKLFRARGFQAVTVERIASEAGISRGTFYLHFRDKQEVSVAIGTRSLSVLYDHYRRLGALSVPTAHTVERWVRDYFQLVRADQSGFEVGMMASVSSAVFAEADDAILTELIECLSPHLDRFTPDQREVAAARVSCLQVQTAMMAWHLIVRRERFTSEEVAVRAIAELWLDELKK
ncbi:MAG: TetR/AcrR family transcriptional regulator [Propionicimonas sp.]